MIKEKQCFTANGIPLAIAFVIAFPFLVWLTIRMGMDRDFWVMGSAIFGILILCFLSFGFFMVQPNQAAAMTLFGDYKGSTRIEGLRWANPFYIKKHISLRVRNFESSKLKVNELGGSPIEIASVIVWRVVDSAEALFSVDDYQDFVKIQSEAALRQMATSYSYDGDGGGDEEITLRGHANEISEHLKTELQERLSNAGVEVLEARISHLAYAPEIASVMLQRQQAGAIIAARSRIVEGAVTMVRMALDQLSLDNIVELDEERKANMVSNLLVVLCSDKNAQPIVNAGSLY